MLDKVPGSPSIDRLRVIQIIEGYLNMCLKIIFDRGLSHHAENKALIPPTQWGSRPNRSSADCILLKRLSYDGIRILRQNAVIFNNNAKAAFDQMVPSVGGITLRQLGASKNAVKALLKDTGEDEIPNQDNFCWHFRSRIFKI